LPDGDGSLVAGVSTNRFDRYIRLAGRHQPPAQKGACRQASVASA